MGTVETLRQDHTLLRRKLEVLAAALEVAPETEFVVRELCGTLARWLQEHINRETAACSRLPAGRRSPLSFEGHTRACAVLRAIHDLLLTGHRTSLPTVILRLSALLEQLERQMAEQEQRLFPALEAMEQTANISGGMSVNEILQRFPTTERVFQQLHVNRLQEGYESVDELAWRHGLDVGRLLEDLQHAVGGN